MIRYTLRCAADHRFESWFASADAFETLRAGGHLACAVCGSDAVEKALMAPSVAAGRSDPAPRPAAGAETPHADGAEPRPLSRPAHPAERALAALRRRVEETSTDVGRDFARRARAIHAGEEPARPIHGEARPDEAKSLIEDGVPILPLPAPAGRKAN